MHMHGRNIWKEKNEGLLKWYGQVLRLNNERFAKKVMSDETGDRELVNDGSKIYINGKRQ